MPELPEVETARCLAQRHLAGKTIVKVATVDDPIVYEGVPPRRFAAALRGRRVLAVRRRGKHMWMELDRRPWPAFHFGMTGFFDIYRHDRDIPRFLKFELRMEDGTRLAMGDARRLGYIHLLNDPEHEPPISRLGPDPLLDRVPFQALRDALARRKAPIKAVLLDQTVFAGVGNWIADEVLYQARIAPHRLARDLAADEILRLHRRLTVIIRKAVQARADYERFPKSWLFHYRWGKNPKALDAHGERIVHATLGGRTTAWVPTVQG